MAAVSTDTTIAPFQMAGARRMLEVAPSATGIERLTNAIERAVVDDPWQVFDLSKSLIETVCKTILRDRGQEADLRVDGPQLVKITARIVPLARSEHENAAAIDRSSQQMISGMCAMIQGICEIRNKEPGASHGRDAYIAGLGRLHAEAVARTTDSLVSFLYLAHKKDSMARPGDRIHYDDHDEFNEYLDEMNDMVEILDLTYAPSDVLFGIDKPAYKDKLTLYLSDIAEETADAVESGGDS